jgi:predicted DNA-binding ArsR family transcriptional regulator
MLDSLYVVESVEIDEREKRYHTYFTSVQSALKNAYPDKNKSRPNSIDVRNEQHLY